MKVSYEFVQVNTADRLFQKYYQIKEISSLNIIKIECSVSAGINGLCCITSSSNEEKGVTGEYYALHLNSLVRKSKNRDIVVDQSYDSIPTLKQTVGPLPAKPLTV